MKRKKIFPRFLSILLSVVMLVGLLPMTVSADEELEPVSYYDENGVLQTCDNYILVTSATTKLIGEVDDQNNPIPTWFVAESSVYFSSRIEISGDVHLISTGYCTASKGIHVPSDTSISFYSSDGYASFSISLHDNDKVGHAALGGNSGEVNGKITINAPMSTDIYDCGGGAAIGTGANATGTAGMITINGGTVNAIAHGASNDSYGAAAIGGGYHSDAPDIYINCHDKAVYAISQKSGAGIGGGEGGSFHSIVIDSGSVYAIGDNSFGHDSVGMGNGSGASPDYSKCSIRINGGRLQARGYNGARAFVCGATENPDLVPDGTVSVYKEAEIRADLNGDGSATTTTDVASLYHSDLIDIDRCTHKDATYILNQDGTQHKMVCTSCRTEFEFEEHVIDGNGICSKCGHGAEAVIQSVAAIFEGQIQLRYRMTFSKEVLDDAGAYVSFTTKESEETRLLIKDAKSDGNEKLFYCPVYVPEFNEDIILKVFDGEGHMLSLYSGQGTDYSSTGFAYSLYQYTFNIDNAYSSASTNMKRLCNALFDYGTAAIYRFFPNKTNGLYSNIRANLNDALLFEGFSDHAITLPSEKIDGLDHTSIQLYYDADNTLRVIFYLDGSVDVSQYSFSINGVSKSPISVGSDGYAIEVRKIAAPDLDLAYDFTISLGDDSYTIRASALSYAYMASKSSNQTRQNLGKTLFLYWKAAKNCFPGNT